MIAACSSLLTLQCFVHGTPISLAVDTGAHCNLLSESAYSQLHNLHDFPLQPTGATLRSVQGLPLSVSGSATIPFSFSADVSPISAEFIVTSDFNLSCDGLIGLSELSSHDIAVFPNRGSVYFGGQLFPSMVTPSPLLTQLTPQMSKPPVASTFSAVVVGDQCIKASSSARVSVRLPSAPIASCVLSLPDTSRIHSLALEGTLSAVRDGHITDALVTNLTGSPINLKSGVSLGSFELDDSLSFDEAPNFVSAVSAQSDATPNLAEVISELTPHIKVSDYSESSSQLLNLLARYRSAIALPGDRLGATTKATHRIVLKADSKPCYTPPYRLPHSQRATVDSLVDDMLKDGVIQESYSPWNSPLFLVPKRDGTYRPVIDFRKVNNMTVPDHYPLPVLSDILQSIGKGNSVFSTLDLKSGFFQIPLDKESREITAFSTHNAHFEFLRTPFGLRNAPLTLQRLVNNIFSGVIGKGLFIYLDDLIVVSPDVESHLLTLETVLRKLAEAGLTLNPSKCAFLRKRIEFLGHVVDGQGIHTSDSKVKAVRNFPTPKSVDNVRSFLGLAGYYRAFIKGFAQIASPLTCLLKKDTIFQWTPARQQSFDRLKEVLTSAPVLTFPDYKLPFIICTDASSLGIGAVLMQQTGPHPNVIAYASRVLNDAERKYSVTHLEGLGLIWSLKHFREIILGYPITVYTDHSALTGLFHGKNLSGRLARWYLTLQEFNPEIKYLPGRANRAADALSRNIPISAVENVETFNFDELSAAQRCDPLWSKVVYALESGDNSTLPNLQVPLSQFSLENGLLCRNIVLDESSVQQLVIPSPYVDSVLRLVHYLPISGHPGRDRTLAAARKRYYWPTMRTDIISHVARCLSCAATKGSTHTAPILPYPIPSAPFDTVSIDLLQLPRSHQGCSYLLVSVDHFSRFVVLSPLPNKTAEVVAHALVSDVICPYSTPKVLLSDNGTEFKNQVLASICASFNIKHTFITALHPASNGLVERANRKILEVLRHVVGPLQSSWQDWLPLVAACINNSVTASTGKSPHYVVFGSDKRLPFDLLSRSTPLYSVDDYAAVQQHVFQLIHKSVREKLLASRSEMIQRQHDKATPVSFTVGDSVMKSAPARQSKLSPKFSGPYVISEQLHGNKFRIIDSVLNTSEIVHSDRLKKVDGTNTPPPPSPDPSPSPDPNPPHSPTPQSSPSMHQANSSLPVSKAPTHSYYLRSRS